MSQYQCPRHPQYIYGPMSKDEVGFCPEKSCSLELCEYIPSAREQVMMDEMAEAFRNLGKKKDN